MGDTQMTESSIGEFIRLHRKRAHLSQADLAKMVGTHFQTFGNYERDGRDMPLSVALRACEILGISPNDLAGWDGTRATRMIPNGHEQTEFALALGAA